MAEPLENPSPKPLQGDFDNFPPAPFDSQVRPEWMVPSDAECFGWWDDYAMPDHIRTHSLLVADVATALAARAVELGMDVSVQSVRASALLHDLAKIYTVDHGGSHAQLGGAWVQELTGNPVISMGVVHHVWWPYRLEVVRNFLPISVIYGDKRVMHSRFVGLEARFDDLAERYGHIPQVREKLIINLEQTRRLEEQLNQILKVKLDACTFDSGRLVQ